MKHLSNLIAGVVLKWVSASYDGNGGTAASVTVTPQFSGTVMSSVSFYDGTTVVKTVSLNAGVAKFTTSALAQGKHTIMGTYKGSGKFGGRPPQSACNLAELNFAYLPSAGMKVRRHLFFVSDLPPAT